MFPFFTGNFRGAQCPGEYRHSHLDFLIPAVFGLGVYRRENGGIRVAFDALRQSLRTQRITLDIKMRVVNRIVRAAPGGDVSERSRINHLSAAEGGFKHLAVTGTTVDTPRAYTAHGRDVPRTIGGPRGVISMGSLQIHFFLSPFYLALLLFEAEYFPILSCRWRLRIFHFYSPGWREIHRNTATVCRIIHHSIAVYVCQYR